MKSYQDLLLKEGYPSASKLCDERAAALFVTFKAPPDWYGFPPALLPIMSDGTWPVYIGLWKHWFVPRAPTFVELNIGDDYKLEEIARTDRQLALLMLLRLIVLKDDVDSDVRWLAEHLGLSHDDVSRIDAFSQEYGDDPEYIFELPEFSEMLPLSFADGKPYDGEFPPAVATNIAGLEIPIGETMQQTPSQPWLDPLTDKVELFSRYLSDGDFGRAWLTLNSRGWSFAAAAKAINELSIKAGDAEFSVVASRWAEHAATYDGAY